MKKTVRAKIEELLEEGPATAFELAPDVGYESRGLSAVLCDLHKRGIIGRKPFYVEGNARTNVWLYGLPQHIGHHA